jgi:glucosyl-3-phosphoglycerate synthase
VSDFHQNGVISTLHNLSSRSLDEIERELRDYSKSAPIELILPSLYSELDGPALKNIVECLSKIKYLNHITIGLDRATKKEYIKAKEFFSNLNQSHSVLWNDSPKMKKLDKDFMALGIAPDQAGKGKNVWYCMGYTYSRNEAKSVALHDCDIMTYSRELLAKLVYPVANPHFNYEFCKGYYPRVRDGSLGGRVTRLLVTPLLKTFKKVLGHRDYIEFIDVFRYPLAGEFSFRSRLLKEIRIPCDWGLEIGLLSEMQRNQAYNRICQVDIADTYDHKHQPLSEENKDAGLSKMSIDITKALIRKLATQGNIFSLETFRSIKATYYRVALDMIDIYRSDAKMNGLSFDSHIEEKTVELFALNIMKAGESFFENPMETPFIPTWNRVLSAIPDFLDRFKLSVELDNEELRK